MGLNVTHLIGYEKTLSDDRARGKGQVINQIHPGDCIEVMKTWPDALVQTCVTSPPYWGLRDYGTPGQLGLELTPDAYVAKMVEVFREVRRVLREDGTLWLNLGDSYAGSWGAMSHDLSEKAKRAGMNYRPVTSVKQNGLKPKDLVGIPWRVAFALQADGWYLRSDIIWHKPNPMPESVTDRPTKAHEYLFLLTKSERYYYDAEAIKESAIYGIPNSPESIKSPYGQGFARRAKTRGSDKQSGHGRRHAGFNDRWDQMEREEQCSGMRNKRSVWTIATQPYAEAHFATFPPDLIKPCILAGSKAGDVVLDPFMGAGTTALVAAHYDRSYIGAELNAAYIAMAQNRIANERAQLKMAI